MEGFSFCKFCKSCFQRGIPLLSITSRLVVIRSSKNSIFYRGQAETCFPANIRLCEDVLKCLENISWATFFVFCLPSCLQDVFKACLQDVFLKPYWRRLDEDVSRTHLEDVFRRGLDLRRRLGESKNYYAKGVFKTS